MGRDAKLACGALLVGLGCFLAFTSAPNAAVDPKILGAIFGVPGFLLLLFGILPSRDARTRMVFRPGRLAGGLAASAVGGIVLFLFYQVVHVAPVALLVGAALAVPCGVLFAASCWSEAPGTTPSRSTAPGERSRKAG